MSVVLLSRFNEKYGELPACIDLERVWQFDRLIGRRFDLFHRLLADHLALYIEYNAHCRFLLHEMEHPQCDIGLTQQVQATLMMAETLFILYRDYLGNQRTAAQLLEDQRKLRQFLIINAKINFIRPIPVIPPFKYIAAQSLRSVTPTLNYPRLIVARSRRFLVNFSLIVSKSEGYRYQVNRVDYFLNPTLTYFAWLFFLPRLVSNMCIMLKHLFPGRWMSEEEKGVPVMMRFKTQFERRYFDLINDIAWMLLGLVNCFLLIGKYLPLSLYLTATVQIFDFGFSYFRYHKEMHRYQTIIIDYQNIENGNGKHYLKKDATEHLGFLREALEFEKKRLKISAIHNGVLVMALWLAVPFMVSLPAFILIGNALAVLATIFNHLLLNSIEIKKPKTHLTPFLPGVLKRHSLFTAHCDQLPAVTEEESLCLAIK